MNENDKQVSGMEATANPAPSTGRRRLVKGAIFAVPAIVTLRRTSAQTADGSIWCVVTKFKQVEAKDDNGQTIQDEFGNPTYVSTEEPDPNDSCFLSLGDKAPLG